jgi:hypothetical protein
VAPELASYDGAAHLQQGVALMITACNPLPASTHQPYHLKQRSN